MTTVQKRSLYKIALSALLLIAVEIFAHTNFLPLDSRVWVIPLLYLLPYLPVGVSVILDAMRNIFHGDFFDESFLMALASVTAFALREHTEAVIVMLFYQIGSLFESLAVERSRRSVAALMNICPEYANLASEGSLQQVPPGEIAVGSTIVVKPGERVPLDGVVISGSASLDTSALTGESAPCHVETGSEVLSGCINRDGVITLRVTKEFTESTVMRILTLVEEASDKKSRTENFITTFARWYTPTVVLAAILLATLPPLILGGAWDPWILRALTFLVISCPCALVISVPMTYFGGIGGASARGILIKGSNYIDALAKVKTIVFDKTGTLTHGEFRVTEISPHNVTSDELLSFAVAAETYSAHPIAHSIRRAAEHLPKILPGEVTEVTESAGRGTAVTVNGNRIFLGNRRWMEENGIPIAEDSGIGTVVYIAKNNNYVGKLRISDTVKSQARSAISALHEQNIDHIVMLTGDTPAEAGRIADLVGIHRVVASLLPDGKVRETEALLTDKNRRGKLAFVGDGINDAPSLALADIGIAMGALGSDAAIEAADVVLTDDNPFKIVEAIKLSRKTVKIAKENILFSLGVKLAVMLLGAAGLAGMWAAVFADVGVCVLAIGNAMRTMKH